MTATNRAKATNLAKTGRTGKPGANPSQYPLKLLKGYMMYCEGDVMLASAEMAKRLIASGIAILHMLDPCWHSAPGPKRQTKPLRSLRTKHDAGRRGPGAGGASGGASGGGVINHGQ